MRLHILVIVLKLLLNLLWNYDFLCFQICEAVEPFDLELFQGNDYLQSELGMPPTSLEDVISDNENEFQNEEDELMAVFIKTAGDTKTAEISKDQETGHEESAATKEEENDQSELKESQKSLAEVIHENVQSELEKSQKSLDEVIHENVNDFRKEEDEHADVVNNTSGDTKGAEIANTQEKGHEEKPATKEEGHLHSELRKSETSGNEPINENVNAFTIYDNEHMDVVIKTPGDTKNAEIAKNQETVHEEKPATKEEENLHSDLEKAPTSLEEPINENVSAFTSDDDGHRDIVIKKSGNTKAAEIAKIQETEHDEKPGTKVEENLQSELRNSPKPLDKAISENLNILTNEEDEHMDVVIKTPGDTKAAEIVRGQETDPGERPATLEPNHLSDNSDLISESTVSAKNNFEHAFPVDQNLSNEMNQEDTVQLNAEESVVVEREVLPQDFMSNGNLETEEKAIEMEPDTNTTMDFGTIILEPYILPDTVNFSEYQSLQLFQRRIKDTFLLQYIEEDISLNPKDSGVLAWLLCRHNSQELLVGRRLTDLLVINPNDLGRTAPYVINIDSPISALTTYTYWNFALHQEEGVIIVASIDKILWYRHNSVKQKFELFGQWEMGGHIKEVAYFLKGTECRLVVGFSHTILQIFKFQLEEQKYWMTQELYMEQEFDRFIIENTGNEIALILSHEEVVTVYNMNPIYEQDFQLKQSIVAPGLSQISSFSIRGQVYLALTGYEAQIMLYNQGEFRSFVNLGSKFGKVEHFLPISMKNNQDDLMLLVYFENNTQSLIQNLQWNGKTFESGFPVPCRGAAENSKNLQCLLELQLKTFSNNILSSCIFSKDNEIYLIIPGLLQDSKIFRFHFELLPENSELMDLLEYFIILSEWFEKQQQIFSQVQEFLKTPDDVLLKKALQQETASIDYVEAPEFLLDGDVNEIYLNDHLWTQEDSEINLDSLINLVEDLDKSLLSSRQRRDLNGLQFDDLEFDNVWVEELEIENLNGEPFYVQNGILAFPGDVQFEDLNIVNREDDHAHKRQMLEEVVVVEGDLEFDVINGIKWSDLMKNIVLRNQLVELEAMKVNGEVVMEEDLSLKSLNALNFPEDYLLANGPRSSIVTAKKYFVNSLSANSVDTDGLINGQNPAEAITLMDEQEWHGFPIFNHLEVSEKLELYGTAHGRNVEHSPFNPTLQESKVIDASCIFNNLQVNGPIVLMEDLDDKPLSAVLNDIVQRPENPLQNCNVNSSKSFEDVTFPIDFVLENNAINNLPPEKFVTAHTLQHLTVDTLDGYVYFYNLTLEGLYDGIKLEDVLREAIPLDKPLDLGSTHLIFDDQAFQADTLVVLENVNGVSIKDNLQTLQEDLILDTAEFDNLHASHAEFAGDILGPGTLNKINLENFVNDRSWHEPPIEGNIFVDELIAHQGIQADELHGIDAKYLFEFLQGIDDLPEMVLNGQIQVDHVTVMGDVQLHKVNGQMFDEDIQMTVIWLNRQNHLGNNLTFQNLLQVQGDLRVDGNYQNVNLNALLNDFVWKDANATSIGITATKSFLNEVEVLHNFHVEAINGQVVRNLAMKNRQNIFKGSMKINGNLITPELEVLGSNAAFNMNEIEKFLYYSPALNSFVLKGSIHFDYPVQLEDLTVMGSYNNLPNLKDFFDHLIDKALPCELKGNNTFTGRITIDQGLHVHRVNDIDVEQLFTNLVFIQDSRGIIISSPIKFLDPIRATNMSIMKSLKALELNGCPLSEWLNDTLRVDEDKYIPHYLHFSMGSLDGNAFKAHFLNDINLQDIVTLNTPQVFNKPIQFSNLFLSGQIIANGTVNSFDLEKEYSNTFMIYGGQHISTPLIIQSIEVSNDLEIRCLVNKNVDLQDVATLEENLDLQSPIYFRSLYTPQFITKDHVTGINFTKWFTTAMRAQRESIQYVTGKWKTRLLNVQSTPQDFEYMSNELHPSIRNTRGISLNQPGLCDILKDFWKKLREKTIKIKYIEEDFGLDPLLDNTAFSRRKILSTQFGEDIILFINLDCSTYLYKWNIAKRKFIPFKSFESGYIDQVAMLQTQEPKAFSFITSYDSSEPIKCSLRGLNLWTSTKTAIEHQLNIGENLTDFYVSKANESLIYLLTGNEVRELNLANNEIKEKWIIPSNSNADNESSYQFLQKDLDTQDILVTNGKQTIRFTHPNSLKTKKEVTDKYYSSPLPPWLSISTMPDDEPLTLLKPNSTLARKFVFADFSQTMQRIVLDIIEKLNHQINITQLTIPESDLYDEHLIPDFLFVMEQLQQHKIFSKSELKLNISNLTIPENPAHVLASRVLFVIWPKLEELQEIHILLYDNQTHSHSMYRNLTQSLGSLIEDVLEKAYASDKKDYNENLLNVVEAIRRHQKALQEIVRALQIQDHLMSLELVATASETKQRFHRNNEDNRSVVPKSEILPLVVGAVNNSVRLLAISKPYANLTPDRNSTIYLHSEDLRGSQFQIISAHRPRSLIQLRLGSETLFGFIENCCHVQIWKYQGVQGFIKYANFKSDSPIVQLHTLRVPHVGEETRWYVLLLLKDKIKFYHIAVEGRMYDPPNLPCS